MSTLSTSNSRSVKPAVVVAACVAQLLVILDSTVLNVALPAIGASLRFTEENLHLVINAFTIPFAGLLLLSGRLADLFGARNVFATGAALVLLGSFVGGSSSSSEVLIAARVVQGAGSAAMVPAALSLIVGTFDDKVERGKALGLWGAAGGGGGALGVLIGGVLVEYASWHWALLMNVPVCLFLFYLAARHIPNVRAAGSGRVNVVGAILVTLVLALTVIALTSRGVESNMFTSLLWAAAAIALTVFIAHERWWASNPIIPPRLLVNRGLVIPSLVLLLGGASLASTFYFLTLTYQLVHKFSAMQTGLAYLPLSLACFGGAGLGSAVIVKIGGRLSMFLGAVLCVVGLTGFALLVNGSYWGSFFWWSVIFGFGVGVIITTTVTTATDSSTIESQGVTSGALSTCQHVGGALGLAALVGIDARSVGADVGNAAAHASSYSVAFACCAGFAAVAALIALWSPRQNVHSTQ